MSRDKDRYGLWTKPSNDNMPEFNLKYRDYTSQEGKIFANVRGPKVLRKLEPGCYTLHFDYNNNFFWFERAEFVSDNILDLPSPEYTQIVNEMNFFLNKEIEEKFNKMGFIYKRSALLYGLPGSGKTIIVNRVCKDIIKSNGICLWVKNPSLLEKAYDILNDLQPETLTGVIFEEFDSIVQKSESDLLTILDGQVQKRNVIYLATTNYIEKIPKRLYRPGRFSSVIEVKFPIAEARQMYLESKLTKEFKDIKKWVEKTEGLSIDELKEMVQAVEILQTPFNKVLKRIKDTKGLVDPVQDENDY